MKEILLIATGGTIASSNEGNGLTPHYDVSELLSFIPQIKNKCNITGTTIMNIDSSNMTPDSWIKIASVVHKHYNDYDGFVITHGTDTMAYTSAALTYMLEDLDKPVIVTGSQYSIEEKCTDALQNLYDSFLFAIEEIAGVFVTFDGKLICGTRAMKIKTKSYNAFKSVNFPYIAEIKHGRISYNDSTLPLIKPKNSNLIFNDKMCDNISIIKIFPGMDPEIFTFIKDKYAGVIVESFGIGGIPFENKELVSKIHEMADNGLAVIVTTQCLEEGIDFDVYEVGKKIPADKIIYGNDMNTEALVAKLMCALGKSDDITEMKTYIETPVMFDITN